MTETADQPKALRLVPFSSAWITHDKLDLKAIYRRPRFKEDEYGEPKRIYDDDGNPTWDLTGPLPVKQHNRWKQKGFEYVTLADRDSLILATRAGTIEGGGKQYDQHRTGGPWNYKLYAMGQISDQNKAAAQLEADVHRFGSEAVQEIRRQTDPDFTLPPKLQNIVPGKRSIALDGVDAPKKTGKEAAA